MIGKYKEIGFVAIISLFLVFLGIFEFGYVNYQRGKFRNSLPDQWEKLPFNGTTNFLIPAVAMEAETPFSKVNQIRIHGFPYDPYIKENRDFFTWILDAVNFYFLAILSLPFSRIQDAFIFISFGLLGVWFPLLYIFFRKIFVTEEINPWLYALPALIPICLADIFRGIYVDFTIPTIGKWLWLFINLGFLKVPLEFTRVVSPLLTILFLLAWLLALVLYLEKSRERSICWAALIGFSGGFLALVRYFEWTFGMSAIGIFWIITLIRKDLRLYKAPMTVAVLFGFISSLIFLYILRSHTDASVVMRAGWTHSRSFDIGSIFVLFIGILSIVSGLKDQGIERVFWLLTGSSMIGAFFLLNMNILLGFYIQRDIYYRPVNFFISIMFSGWLVSCFKKYKWKSGCLVQATTLLLVLSFFNVKSFAEKHYKICGLPGTWENAFQWINRNVQTDSKILTASPTASRLLPLYTCVKLQVADGFPIISKTPTDENLKRMAVLLKTLSLQPSVIFDNKWMENSTTIKHELRMADHLNISDLDKSWGSFLAHLDPQLITGNSYKDKIQSYYDQAVPLLEDYYVWVNKEDQYMHSGFFEDHKDIKLVYKNEGVEIFKFSRN